MTQLTIQNYPFFLFMYNKQAPKIVKIVLDNINNKNNTYINNKYNNNNNGVCKVSTNDEILSWEQVILNRKILNLKNSIRSDHTLVDSIKQLFSNKRVQFALIFSRLIKFLTPPSHPLKGGAGGKKFVTNAAKYGGTGGKSKLNRPPQPMPDKKKPASKGPPPSKKTEPKNNAKAWHDASSKPKKQSKSDEGGSDDESPSDEEEEPNKRNHNGPGGYIPRADNKPPEDELDRLYDASRLGMVQVPIYPVVHTETTFAEFYEGECYDVKDCGGGGICGMACVSVLTASPMNFKVMAKHHMDVCIAANNMALTWSDTIGDEFYLRDICKGLGFNLVILRHNDPGPLNGTATRPIPVCCRHVDRSSHRDVVLVHMGPQQNGHYRAVVPRTSPESSLSVHDLNKFMDIDEEVARTFLKTHLYHPHMEREQEGRFLDRFLIWAYGLSINTYCKIKKVSVSYNFDDREVRVISHRREKIEQFDTYSMDKITIKRTVVEGPTRPLTKPFPLKGLFGWLAVFVVAPRAYCAFRNKYSLLGRFVRFSVFKGFMSGLKIPVVRGLSRYLLRSVLGENVIRNDVELENSYSLEHCSTREFMFKSIGSGLALAGALGLGRYLAFSVLGKNVSRDDVELETSDGLFDVGFHSHEQCRINEFEGEKWKIEMTRKTLMTDSSKIGLVSATVDKVRLVGSMMSFGRNHILSCVSRGDRLYNPPPCSMMVDKADIVSGNVLNGGSMDEEDSDWNGFKKIQMFDSIKQGVLVASSPIGHVKVLLDGEVRDVTAGSMCISGTFEKILACQRALCVDQTKVDSEVMSEFVAFSIDFLDQIIDCLQVEVEPEEVDPRPFFIKHYRGKKTTAEIARVVGLYEKWLADPSGSKCNKKYLRQSAFTKFENSGKMRRGKVFCKPRLIMTQSPHELITCCQVHKLLHAWKYSDIRLFQVKMMTPAQVRAKIEDASDRKSQVTDYSSFEASISAQMREIENHVIKRLCQKYGYMITWEALDSLLTKKRELHMKGTQFNLFTRASGHPHTSDGNGIVGICVMHFSAYRKGVIKYYRSPGYKFSKPLWLEYLEHVVVEGDDAICGQGTMDKDLIGTLGLNYSAETNGNYCGDFDFLSSLTKEGKTYLNVGKCMSVFWVKTTVPLKRSKQLFILRCMAMSMNAMSPGHPMLFAVYNRIMRNTKHTNMFKNAHRYLDKWKGTDKFIGKKSTGVAVVDESMRELLALGNADFPGIPVHQQLEFERIMDDDSDMFIGSILTDFENVRIYALCDELMDPEYGKHIRCDHTVTGYFDDLSESGVVKSLGDLKAYLG